MNRILMVSIAVTALAMIGVSETAQARHYRGCHYGGGYSYAVPVYSYAPAYSYAGVFLSPAYSYAPAYRSAYVQPTYGASIGFGQNYYGGNRRYFAGNGGYHRGHIGHYGGYGGHYRGHHH